MRRLSHQKLREKALPTVIATCISARCPIGQSATRAGFFVRVPCVPCNQRCGSALRWWACCVSEGTASPVMATHTMDPPSPAPARGAFVWRPSPSVGCRRADLARPAGAFCWLAATYPPIGSGAVFRTSGCMAAGQKLGDCWGKTDPWRLSRGFARFPRGFAGVRAMIDIGNATLRWKGGRVWVTAGDDRLRSGECGEPIGGLSDAMAAAWLAVT